MLNLYASPYSPYALKIQFFLEETGIPYKYSPVNFREGNSRAQLNQINPLGKVPAIELNGFTLGESSAILRYLAARYEQHSFYPLNLEDRAQVDMLSEFASLHIGRWMSTLAFNLHSAPKFGMAVDQKAIEDARANLPEMLTRFDRVIAGRTFLAGANLTLADVTLLPFAAQRNAAQVSLADYPNLNAWTNRMVERPAWKKVEAAAEKALASR